MEAGRPQISPSFKTVETLPSTAPFSCVSKRITEPRIEIGVEPTRTKQDNEITDYHELEEVMKENKKHEKEFWPGLADEEMTFLCSPLFFLINLIIFPTGYTFFLELKESCDELVCRHHIREKVRQVLRAIDKALEEMGGKSSKQDNADGAKVVKSSLNRNQLFHT